MDMEDYRTNISDEGLPIGGLFLDSVVMNCSDETAKISTNYSKGLSKCKKKIVRLWDHLKRRVESLKLPSFTSEQPERTNFNYSDPSNAAKTERSPTDFPNFPPHSAKTLPPRKTRRQVARSKSFTEIMSTNSDGDKNQDLITTELCDLASSWRLVQAEVKRLRRLRRHSVDASLMASRRLELELTLRDLERHIAVLSCFLQNHPLLEASQGLGMALKSLEEASVVVMRERLSKLTGFADHRDIGKISYA